MRSRAACGCKSATQAFTISLSDTAVKFISEAPGLDLGQIEQVVDEADHMLARGMDVGEIIAIAPHCRPDRSAPRSMTSAKPMMALSGPYAPHG